MLVQTFVCSLSAVDDSSQFLSVAISLLQRSCHELLLVLQDSLLFLAVVQDLVVQRLLLHGQWGQHLSAIKTS